MTLLIILIVTGLVAWALRLMERALVNQEFSLMLAGFLVASSAAAMMGVYFLMGDYLLYIHQLDGLESTYGGSLELYATELNGDLPSPHLIAPAQLP
ncbi:MAG: hypothetical protein AAFU71_08185 [Cyanobacteria bacterium J06632_22]